MNHKETNTNEEHIYNKKLADNSVDRGPMLFSMIYAMQRKK